jgi:hypothetical protein
MTVAADHSSSTPDRGFARSFCNTAWRWRFDTLRTFYGIEADFLTSPSGITVIVPTTSHQSAEHHSQKEAK